ncbi:hypothetical protein GQ457_03G030430 [Hibiscus cannabinus]
MSRMDFCEWWIQRVMKCVTSTSFSLVLNGERHEEFRLSRGLRQGDLLSHFLFLFISNIFSWIIEKHVDSSQLDGFKIKNRCPLLSHLMFADDCLMFSTADQRNCETILKVLEEFQKMTGQTINIPKSSVFFSPNLSDNLKSCLLSILGFDLMEEGSLYLGLPTIWGRSKKKGSKIHNGTSSRQTQGVES